MLLVFFEELHNVRSDVTDAVQYNKGVFFGGMLFEWDIQQSYRENQFFNDPYLTRLIMSRSMVHSGEKSLKVQVTLVETNDESIESLGLKLKEYLKEQVSFNNKFKDLVNGAPEGSKAKKS